jgi:hypothetical protein
MAPISEIAEASKRDKTGYAIAKGLTGFGKNEIDTRRLQSPLNFKIHFLAGLAPFPRRSVILSRNPIASRTLRTVEKFGSFSPAKAR